MDEHIVISIARQYGSGGRTVGKMLAEKLGISFYDKEIIRMASDESGIDLGLFGKVEGGNKIKPSLFNKSSLYRGKLVQPDSKEFISDENIFSYQAKVVKDLAEKESYVIVGRCVNYVLKDRPIPCVCLYTRPGISAWNRHPKRFPVPGKKLRNSF